MSIAMRPRRSRAAPLRPEPPVVPDQETAFSEPDMPFTEGSRDTIDPDLRHRLISEAAYRHYVQRNYEDGHDLEDWLQAEAEVDHMRVDRAGREPS